MSEIEGSDGTLSAEAEGDQRVVFCFRGRKLYDEDVPRELDSVSLHCQWLDMSENALTDACIHDLCQSLSALPHLRKLSLQNNSFTADGVATLLLQSAQCPQLVCCEVGHQFRVDYSSTLESGRLARVLEQILCAADGTSLVKLGLEDLALGRDAAMGIAQGLRKNRRLRILNLSGNRITVHGAEALAEALQENNSLQELRLDGCLICADGSFAMGDMLTLNRGLRKLNLGQNRLRGLGIYEIAESLRVNNTLHSLVLSKNLINKEGWDFLKEAMRVNTSLVNLTCSKLPGCPVMEYFLSINQEVHPAFVLQESKCSVLVDALFVFLNHAVQLKVAFERSCDGPVREEEFDA